MRVIRAMLAAAITTWFVVCAGACLSADEPKAPDLGELRDAVKAAGKRGTNVDEIQKALNALEKSLAGGFTPPKEGVPAPAELVALREAVETAAKKGENVDEIRKQLAAVEVAMTGKAYEPPKPGPSPLDNQQKNPLPGRNAAVGGVAKLQVLPRPLVVGGGGQVGAGKAAGKADTTTITINGVLNNFRIQALRGDIRYVITGDPATPDEAKITITKQGANPINVVGLKQVPDEYRPAVEKLLQAVKSQR